MVNSSTLNLDKLEQSSMLYQAEQNIKKYNKNFWFGNNSYSQPKTDYILNNYSVWLDLYPVSVITDYKNNQKVLDIYSDPKLLELFAKIGIKVIHTNPMQLAGSYSKKLEYNNSIDGGYDRISYDIDPKYGDNDIYKEFTNNAKEADILIAGDVIPGHTGISADFILALYNYKDYPDLYMMRAIEPEHWHLLPNLSQDPDNNFIKIKNLNDEQVNNLIELDYIPAQMEELLFYEQGVKETNWSVTEEITGYDGITRRWLYLHMWKIGQPMLNWHSPNFSAHKLITGDLINHMFNLGTSILRLDATMYLAIENIKDNNNNEIFCTGHPLGTISTKQLAMMMRKFGGFSYEENCCQIEALKKSEEFGPELSYDFLTRTGFINALATGDSDYLHFQQSLVLKNKINTNRLIHGLQNHDNLTYETVDLNSNLDQKFIYKNQTLYGREIKNLLINNIKDFCSKNNLKFNIGFGGILAHFAELISARLNIDIKYKLEHKLLTTEEQEQIKKLMLLAAFYNMMQPGVFQISAWDLIGAVNKPSIKLDEYLSDGDLRWLCRSGFEFVKNKSDPKHLEYTENGLAKCYMVFGYIDEQLLDNNSFINKLIYLLNIREKTNINNSKFLELIDTVETGINICLYFNNSTNKYYVVINNFSDQKIIINKYINTILQSAKINQNYISDHINDHVEQKLLDYQSDNIIVYKHTGKILEL